MTPHPLSAYAQIHLENILNHQINGLSILQPIFGLDPEWQVLESTIPDPISPYLISGSEVPKTVHNAYHSHDLKSFIFHPVYLNDMNGERGD